MNRSNNTSSPNGASGLQGLYDRVINSIAVRPRTVVTVVVVLLVVGSVGVGTIASANAQPGNNSGNTTQTGEKKKTFAVKQGNTCYTITPLGDGSNNIVSYYNYRGAGSGYSSRGTTDLQIEGTSQFFFYQGNGGISLVMLHDRFTGNASTGGGAVTLDMRGLPVTGGWVVKDDGYQRSNDTFTFNKSRAKASWSWGGGRADGGVYQAEPSAWDSRIKIIPHFNRESAAYPDPEWEGGGTSNQIQRWIVRSSNGKAHALNLYEPVVIEPGKCGQMGNKKQTSPPANKQGSTPTDQKDTSTDTAMTPTTSGDSAEGTAATGPGFGIGLTVLALAVALIAILRRR